LGAADHHVRDRAATIQQHADFASDFEGDLGELSGEFVADDSVGRDTPAIEALDLLKLARPKPLGIAEDSNGLFPRRPRSARIENGASSSRAGVCQSLSARGRCSKGECIERSILNELVKWRGAGRAGMLLLDALGAVRDAAHPSESGSMSNRRRKPKDRMEMRRRT